MTMTHLPPVFPRYFNRDVDCIRTFFRRRFQYESVLYPRFKSILSDSNQEGDGFRLDVVVAASGFAKRDMKVLEDVGLISSFFLFLRKIIYFIDST